MIEALVNQVHGENVADVTGAAAKIPSSSGIDFNQDEKPTFADFAYLAFTIAVTYGVTETTSKNCAIRLSALQQVMVAYLFGAVILAVTVQVIGTLSGL